MPGVSIIADSTSDLPRELVDRCHLRVIPELVQFDDETLLDGIDLDTPRLFELISRKKRLPKTASPSPAAFQAVFAEAVASGDDVIFIGISSKLSATCQNARIAAEIFPEGRVRVFDSENVSAGVALLVLHASDLAAEGKSAAEIMTALEQARPKVRTMFMVDTLEYIHMGGRCTGVEALVGSLLKLRPVIGMVEGATAVLAKVRGPRQKCFDWMLDRFASDVAEGLVRPDRVFVTHTCANDDDARHLAGEVRRIMPGVRNVIDNVAGSVIASHCGPGTIGVLYMLK